MSDDTKLFDCEVLVRPAHGLRLPALRRAVRATVEVAGGEYVRYFDVGAVTIDHAEGWPKGTVGFEFELMAGDRDSDISSVALRTIAVVRMLGEDVGVPELEVVSVKVEEA